MTVLYSLDIARCPISFLVHTNTEVSLDIYSHVIWALQKRAVEAMDEVLCKELIESRELVAIP